jgi:hydrogenase maturation factor
VSANDCGDHCITCSDEGVEMRVERIDAARGLALCASDDGSKSTVEIALVSVQPGDRVLVHAGVALTELSTA